MSIDVGITVASRLTPMSLGASGTIWSSTTSGTAYPPAELLPSYKAALTFCPPDEMKSMKESRYAPDNFLAAGLRQRSLIVAGPSQVADGAPGPPSNIP